MTRTRTRRLASAVGSAALALPLTVVGTAPAHAGRPVGPDHRVTTVGLLRRVVADLEPGDSVTVTWTDASGTVRSRVLQSREP